MAVTIGVLIGYMALISVVSILTSKLSKRVDSNTPIGYLLAGKSLPWWLVAVMVAGAAIGGSATIGTAQNAYTVGMSAAWYSAASFIGLLAFAFLILKKLRKFQFSTVPQMLGHYFGEKAASAFALILLVAFFGILTTQIIAGGAIVSAIVPEIPYKLALVITAFVFFIIAFFGGYFGASTSNVINVLVIYIGMTLAVVMGISEFGGTEAIAASLPEGNQWFDPVSGMGLAAVAGMVFTCSFSTLSGQSSFQACAAARDNKSAKIGFFVAAALCLPIGILAAYIGIIAVGAFPGIESSLALPMVVMSFHPVVAGLCLAGLWAADVSTAVGLICAFSTIFTNDIALKLFQPNMTDKRQLVISKIIAAVVVVVALLVAFGSSSIIGIITSVLGLYVPFTIMMILALYFSKLLRKSTFAAVLCAGIVGWLLYMLVPGIHAFVTQAFWAEFPLCIVAWLATLIFDKRKFVVAAEE